MIYPFLGQYLDLISATSTFEAYTKLFKTVYERSNGNLQTIGLELSKIISLEPKTVDECIFYLEDIIKRVKDLGENNEN